MNTHPLFTHFDRIVYAPDAVPRLRRFILDLAIRGRLTSQDSTDEPASILIQRIEMERARIIGRRKEVPKVSQVKTRSDLPPTWCLVPLISLGSWAIGAGFPKNEQGLRDGPIFFLKVSDMNLPGNEKYITTSNNGIDALAAERMRAKIHPPGTIIFPKIGGAIATNKRRILTRPSAIDNNCLGMTFSKELDVEWAYLLLTSIDFTKFQVGTAMPALQQGSLERIPVALPPLPEQRRMVAKVAELIEVCDRLEASLDVENRARGGLFNAMLTDALPPMESAEVDA